MKDDWVEEQAKEFCTSVRDGTHASPKPVAEGRKLVTSKHIVGGRLDLTSAYLITQEDFDEINRRSKVDQWDVLISMIGTVGEACLIKDPPDFAIKNLGLFKTKDELTGKWLYYYLKTPSTQELIRQQSRGTTQQYIPLGALRDFPITYPSDRRIMEGVVDVLSALDDKIELNRRMNATLEAMAQAVFKEWFVARNAPGGAKEEWEEKTFVELLETNVGGDWGQEVADDEHTERVAIIRGADFPDVQNQSRGKVPIRFTKPSKLKTRKLQPGDLVLEISGGTKDRPTGRCVQVTENMLGWFDEPVVAASFCRLLRPKAGLSNYLALHMDYIYRQGKTWSYQNVSTGLSNFQTKEFLQRELLPLPPPEILDAFNAIIDPITAKRTTSESMTLAALRDTLLPKLMRGEVRVKTTVNA